MSTDIRAPRKAKAILNRLVQTKQLTDEGLCWLTNATDPFHDTQVRPCGMPDINVTPTIVQCYTQTATLSNPNPAATTNFDAHIFLLPISAMISGLNLYQRMRLVGGNGALTQVNDSDDSLPLLYSGYNAISVPAGENWQTHTTLPFNMVLGDAISLPFGSMSGQSRIIAMGFEVVNTTPELYRGGSVTAYRSPSAHTYTNFFASASITSNYGTVALPPATQSQAQLYPTSRTWGAEEGCYSIATLNDVDNCFILQKADTVVAMTPMSTQDLLGGQPFPAWGNLQKWCGTGFAGDCAHVVPFDVNGCIFSGLNYQTTLQITTKYYIERIPTISQPDLLVLTRPPSSYDPTALEIYTRAMQELPVGCRVSENPLGEWFNDVMSVIAEWAPKVGAVFGPAGSAIGAGVGSVAQLARNANQPQQQVQNQVRYRKPLPPTPRRGPAPKPPPKPQNMRGRPLRKPLPPIPKKKG